MLAFIQAAFGVVLGFLGKILAQSISTGLKTFAQLLLKFLIKGYCDSCTCGGQAADQASASEETLEVTVKAGGQTITVKVDTDHRKEQSPEERMLSDRCRLPVCRRRLIQLLKMATHT